MFLLSHAPRVIGEVNMSVEIIAILGVGVAIAGLILNGNRGLRGEIAVESLVGTVSMQVALQ